MKGEHALVRDDEPMRDSTSSRALRLPQAASAKFAAPRAILALVLREVGTRYGRRPGGYVWTLIQPLGIIVLLAFAFSLLAKSPALGTSFLLFKATGMLVVQVVITLSNTVGQSMNYSRALLFYPRVAWIDAVIARFLLNGLVVWVVATLILVGIVVYEDLRVMPDWGRIALAMSMATGLGLGMGCLNCYLFQRFPVWQTLWSMITAPLFLVSGVILLFEDMPPLAQQVLWFNPVMHITGIMRDGFYPIYAPGYVSVFYLGVWVAVPMVIGLLLLRQFHRDLLNR